MNRKTERQKDRKTERQKDRKTDKKTENGNMNWGKTKKKKPRSFPKIVVLSSPRRNG